MPPVHADPAAAPVSNESGLLDGLLADDDAEEAAAVDDDGGCDELLSGLLGDDDDGLVLAGLLDDDEEERPAAAPPPEEPSPRRPQLDDLGGPIRELLAQVAGDGVTEADLRLFSHIPVRTLAAAWERLGQGGDPSAVLVWLRRKAEAERREKEVREARQREHRAPPREAAARMDVLAHTALGPAAPPPASPDAAASPGGGGGDDVLGELLGADDDGDGGGDVLDGLLDDSGDADGDGVLDGLLDDDGDDDGDEEGDGGGALDGLLAEEMDDADVAGAAGLADEPAADQLPAVTQQPMEKDKIGGSVKKPAPPPPRQPPPRPVAWDGVMPVRELQHNARWLRSTFRAQKYLPHLHQVVSGDHERLWLLDLFAGVCAEYDGGGTKRREHPAAKLLQVERSPADPRRLRLLFLGAGKSYDLLLQSGLHRERFYEVLSAARPQVRCFAPGLLQGRAPKPGYVTVDAKGANRSKYATPVQGPSRLTKELRLEGVCKINCSPREDESVTLWTGTWTHAMRKDAPTPQELQRWLPISEKKMCDVYCVAVAEGGWQKRHGELCRLLHAHLGKQHYMVLASPHVPRLTVALLCRKALFLAVSNIDACAARDSATVGVSLRIHNTAIAFVAVHQPSRQPSEALLQAGDRVEAHGLRSAVELNGVRGKLVKPDPQNPERWHIACYDDTDGGAARQTRSMHTRNLRRIENPQYTLNDITAALAHVSLGTRDVDMCSQFHHVFLLGHMNVYAEASTKRVKALERDGRLLEAGEGGRKCNVVCDGDSLSAARRRGLLFGFWEEAVLFPPTMHTGAFPKEASAPWRANRVGYPDRILCRALPGTGQRCDSYQAAVGASDPMGVHNAVSATFSVRCLRPHLACFDAAPPLSFHLVGFRAVSQREFPRRAQLCAWSPFLSADGEVRGPAADIQRDRGSGAVYEANFNDHLPPPMRLTNTMPGYLSRQFIVVVIRVADAPPEASFHAVAPVFFTNEQHLQIIASPGEELAGVGALQRHGRLIGEWEMQYRFLPIKV